MAPFLASKGCNAHAFQKSELWIHARGWPPLSLFLMKQDLVGGGHVWIELRRGRRDQVKLSSPLRSFPPPYIGQTGSEGKVIPEPASIFPSSVRLRHIRPCLLKLLEQSSFPECSTLSEKREEGGLKASQRRKAAHKVTEEEARKRQKHG